MAYGDAGALNQQEHAAPMAQTPTPPTPNATPAPGPGGGPAQAPAAPQSQYAGGPFGAPTARPGEPVTHGTNIGPGANSMSLPTPPAGAGPAQPTGAMTQMLQQMSATDTTGILGQLYAAARARGA